MTDYYVHYTNGLDTNPGTEALPWKTGGKVKDFTFSSGDIVYFKRGEVFDRITSLKTANITLDAYGTGPLPLLWSDVDYVLLITQDDITCNNLAFECTATGKDAVRVIGGDGTEIDGTVFNWCEVLSSGYRGFWLYRATNTIIRNCDINNCGNGLDYGSGGAGAGIFADYTSGVQLYNNLLKRNFVGVIIDNSIGANVISHNYAKHSLVNGIDHRGGDVADPNQILSNFVWHKPSFTSGHGIASQSGGDGVHIKHNIVYCDYIGTPINIQCIEIETGYTEIEMEYNSYFLKSGSDANIGKVGSIEYSTIDTYLAAARAEYSGIETGTIEGSIIIPEMVKKGRSRILNIGYEFIR